LADFLFVTGKMQFNDFFSPTFLVDHKQSNSKSAKLMKDKYIYKTRTRTL